VNACAGDRAGSTSGCDCRAGIIHTPMATCISVARDSSNIPSRDRHGCPVPKRAHDPTPPTLVAEKTLEIAVSENCNLGISLVPMPRHSSRGVRRCVTRKWVAWGALER